MKNPLAGNTSAPAVCRRAIIWWLPLLYLLISSSFFLRTYDSAQVKITLLQMGGICLVCFWLCRLIEDGRDAFSADDVACLAPFLAFLASGAISFIHSPYHWSSLDFFLRRIFYMTIALIIVTEFNGAAVTRLVRILTISTWIAVLYGFFQWLDFHIYPPGPGNGMDPFLWRGAFGDRVFSTYGNPNFFADYLVLMFPILACQYFKTRRHSFLVLVALVLFNIYASQTKGAWIGLAISTVLLAGTYVFYFHRDVLRRFKLRIAALMLAVIMAAFAGVAVKLRESFTSVNFRLFTWEATWEMIMTQPLLGTGIGSFWVIYPAFRRPPIFHIEGKHNTETDHAEDEYLEVLFDEGILGFGIFIWLIGSCFVMAYRSLTQMTGAMKIGERAPPRALDLLGFLVALQGMLAHNFFDVSMRFVSSGVYLGLLSGMVVNLARGAALSELQTKTETKPTDGGKRPAALRSPVPAGGAWMSNGLGNVPEGSTIGEPVLWILRLAAWAGVAFFLGVLISQFNEIQAPAQQIRNNGEALQWIIGWGCLLICAARIAWFLAQAVWSTRNVLVPVCVLGVLPLVNLCWGFFRADVYQNLAIAYSRNRQWDAALKYYSKVGDLNPAYIMAFYFSGNVFTDRFNMVKVFNPDWGDKDGVPRDDFDRALDSFAGVAARSPNYVQMHHQMGTLYLKHGDWLIHQGRVEEGQHEWDKALEYFDKYRKIDPVFAPNYYRMAQIDLFRGQYAKAADVYNALIEARECRVDEALLRRDVLRKTLLSYQPYVLRDGQWVHLHESAETYTDLAGAYMMMGDAQRAQDSLHRALEIDSNYGPAVQNMKLIQQRLHAPAALRPVPSAAPAAPAVPTFELSAPRR